MSLGGMWGMYAIWARPAYAEAAPYCAAGTRSGKSAAGQPPTPQSNPLSRHTPRQGERAGRRSTQRRSEEGVGRGHERGGQSVHHDPPDPLFRIDATSARLPKPWAHAYRVAGEAHEQKGHGHQYRRDRRPGASSAGREPPAPPPPTLRLGVQPRPVADGAHHGRHSARSNRSHGLHGHATGGRVSGVCARLAQHDLRTRTLMKPRAVPLYRSPAMVMTCRGISCIVTPDHSVARPDVGHVDHHPRVINRCEDETKERNRRDGGGGGVPRSTALRLSKRECGHGVCTATCDFCPSSSSAWPPGRSSIFDLK
jgi:hypothetical protein